MFRNQLRVRYHSDRQGVPEGCGCSRGGVGSVYEGGKEGRLRVLLVTPPPNETERIFGPYSSMSRFFLNFLLEEAPPIHFVITHSCCVPTVNFEPDCIVEFGAKCNIRKKKLHFPDLRIYEEPETPFNYTTFQSYSIRFERFLLKCGKDQKRDSHKVSSTNSLPVRSGSIYTQFEAWKMIDPTI